MQFSVFIFTPILEDLFQIPQLQAMIYWNIFSFVLGLFIIIWLMRPNLFREKPEGAADFGGVIGWSIIGFVLAWVAQIIAVNIELNVFRIEPGSENTAVIIEITRRVPLFVIVPAIVAPIIEELIFRKIIFKTLYKRMNFFLAAVFSALVFGIIHMEPKIERSHV